MTTESTTNSITVTKTITVDCPQAHAFDVFTSRMSDWWPLDTHVIGAAPGRGVVIEPAPGGSWYEIDAEGKTCPWGRVLEWESPDRVVLAWQLSAEWEYDPDFETEIHVTFTAESPDRTRVELQHRHLERYGDRAAEMEETFQSERAWQGMLAHFATTATT
jgi:uncharacterized protein YndB with AHSA1/START domain